ncbi:hypothetical protein ANO14919_059690 [Xylariales sp. No.14919]|nr:hypothetical protein ANO14919_059690 [Xylariales sp. No.14919]
MVSGVGYLHENPGIERILLREGTYPITEEELSQVMDFALTAGAQGEPDEAHILTYIESPGCKTLKAKGFDVNNLPILDPWSAILAKALAAEKSKMVEDHGGIQGRLSDSIATWAKELPDMIPNIFLAQSDAKSFRDAVLRTVGQQFSNLALTALDQVEDQKSFAEFGVDSMIASEFRIWLWTILKIEVAFPDLLSVTQSLVSLATTVEAQLTRMSPVLSGCP